MPQMPYDHETYWPALVQTCLKRREDQLQLWRSLGEPRVGREEKLFKLDPESDLSTKTREIPSERNVKTETAMKLVDTQA